MLTYSFENIGSDSMYEYLYKCIRDDILLGKIAAGEKLPSKRSFAQNLGVSVVTVEGAYGLLSDEGYIYSLPKKGFFVSDLKPFLSETGSRSELPNYETDESRIVYLADFSSNQTDTDIFPFSEWTKTMRSVMSDRRSDLMVNSPCGGIFELRKAIAGYLMEFRAMKVSPQQIIIGAGTDYLYSLLIQILGRDMIYGVENPGYHQQANIYRENGIKCEYIDIDSAGVVINELEKKKVSVAHVSPSHHFPTGIVMPVSRRYELLGWASKSGDRYIIEDDYDSELRMSGRPLPTLQSIDVSEKVIYMNTFSKTLCSTVRISYMVLPESLARVFYDRLGFYSNTVSNFEQYTLARFIESGDFGKHINRLRRFYKSKRDLILDSIQNHPLRNFVSIREKEAGVHFIMTVKTDKPEEEVILSALEEGVKLDPVSGYYYTDGAGNENTYVMDYSSVKNDRIPEIIDGIYKAII